MAAKGLPWAATHNAWIYAIKDTDSPTQKVLYNTFVVASVEEMSRMPPGSMSMGVEHLDFQYFEFGKHVRMDTMDAMRIMKEDIYYVFVQLLYKKGWYLKDYFDDFILSSQASGLQKYWLMVTTYKQLDPSVHKAMGLSNSPMRAEVKPMDMHRLAGSFLLLGIGIVISVVVFMGEVVLSRMVMVKI